MVGVKLVSRENEISLKLNKNIKKELFQYNTLGGSEKVVVSIILVNFGGLLLCPRKPPVFGVKNGKIIPKYEFSLALNLKPTQRFTSAEPKIIKFIKR